MPNISYIILYKKDKHIHIYQYNSTNYMQLIDKLCQDASNEELNIEWEDLSAIIRQAENLQAQVRF